MKLVEFGLDLPQSDRETRKNFRWQTRCMSALYERSFPGLDVAAGWKVLVECVERVEYIDTKNLLGVFTVQTHFDHGAFEIADVAGRKRLAVEALHGGVLRVAALQQWPKQPFEHAHTAVIESGFINEWTWPKPKASPDRKHKIALHCLHEPERFRGWLVVTDKSGIEVARSLVIDDIPSEFTFVPKMGKIIWHSEKRAALLNKNGVEVAEISVG